MHLTTNCPIYSSVGIDIETTPLLKQLGKASGYVGELKGLCQCLSGKEYSAYTKNRYNHLLH